MTYRVRAHLLGGKKKVVAIFNTYEEAEKWVMQRVDKDITMSKLSSYDILEAHTAPARGNTNGVA